MTNRNDNTLVHPSLLAYEGDTNAGGSVKHVVSPLEIGTHVVRQFVDTDFQDRCPLKYLDLNERIASIGGITLVSHQLLSARKSK